MIKVKFNTTIVSFELVTVDENGKIKQIKQEKEYLHKRTDKYIENQLNELVKTQNAVGVTNVNIKTAERVSNIPVDVALKYAGGVN